jgi:hypothetical protein
MTRPCAHCDRATTNRRWCSMRCRRRDARTAWQCAVCRVRRTWTPSKAGRRIVCSATCRSELSRRRHAATRPRCAFCKVGILRARRKHCSPACHRAALSARQRGRLRSTAPRAKRCQVCDVVFTRRHPSALARTATCGRRCAGRLASERQVARSLARVRQRLDSLTKIEAFQWGYKLGYFRRANRERRGVIARAS